jgi:hypothetical protein
MYSSRVVMLLLEKSEDVYWSLELRNGQRVKGIGGACSTSWKCQKWTVPCKNLEWISTLSDTIMCHWMRRICLDNLSLCDDIEWAYTNMGILPAANLGYSETCCSYTSDLNNSWLT